MPLPSFNHLIADLKSTWTEVDRNNIERTKHAVKSIWKNRVVQIVVTVCTFISTHGDIETGVVRRCAANEHKQLQTCEKKRKVKPQRPVPPKVCDAKVAEVQRITMYIVEFIVRRAVQASRAVQGTTKRDQASFACTVGEHMNVDALTCWYSIGILLFTNHRPQIATGATDDARSLSASHRQDEHKQDERQNRGRSHSLHRAHVGNTGRARESRS